MPGGHDLASVRALPLPVDPTRYTLQDAAGTVRSAPVRWRWSVEGDGDVPGPALVAVETLVDLLRAAGGTGDSVDELADGVQRSLTEAAGRHGPSAGLVDTLGPADPRVQAVEAVETCLSAAGRAVVADRGPAPTRGLIERVNRSGGGVPKTAFDGEVMVGPLGLDGDRQRVRRHHGRPSQALSLWSSEVIDALAAEGHPVSPGSAGENLTIAGVDWSTLRPGVRLVLGAGPDAPVAEVSGWADPCSTIAGSFLEGAFRCIDHGRHPGRSRAYAFVVRPGVLRSGDGVTVVP